MANEATTSTGYSYIKDRIKDQIDYFDQQAKKNQRWYRLLKKSAIVCNILTTMVIALAFVVPDEWKVVMGIVALILSTLVLATYQWEEFANYGAKWEKFRLVAEQLKSEMFLYKNQAGRYASSDVEDRRRDLVEIVETIIRGTDVSYFSLMVDPGRRIDQRLGQGVDVRE
ncbi:MAG: DUF4231 domain-containing protein [Candidatus Poribacteria bacterium]|nr:DUF4231 domain-containing protein [Candidatus Poribacteria bacterium]